MKLQLLPVFVLPLVSGFASVPATETECFFMYSVDPSLSYMESTARVNSHEGGVAEKKRVSSRDAGPEWRREMREKGAYSLTVVHLGYGIMCAAASAPGIHRTHVPRRGGRRKACAEPRRWARMVPQTPTRRQWFRCRQMCESSCRRSGRYPRRLGSCYCGCLHGLQPPDRTGEALGRRAGLLSTGSRVLVVSKCANR